MYIKGSNIVIAHAGTPHVCLIRNTRHMGETTEDPYAYAYCCCMFPTEDGKCMASKADFDAMIARGVQPWVGAGVRTEALVEEAIANGAYLITCNNPDEILRILREKGCHK